MYTAGNIVSYFYFWSDHLFNYYDENDDLVCVHCGQSTKTQGRYCYLSNFKIV